MDIFEWDEETPVTANNLNEMQNIINGNINRIGKLLWEGTFSSGSLQVSGISDYTMIAVLIDGAVLGFGSQRYGGCSFTQYASAGIASFGYRYNYNATTETLSTDGEQTGATNGTNIVPITKIYGIF